MRIGVLGVNHQLAPVELRSRLATFCYDYFHQNRSSYQNLIVLTTCNRIEIYFFSPTLAHFHTHLVGVLKKGGFLDFDQKLYTFFEKDCFHHLLRVTCGLDSAILGETEIQGQVKEAYLKAQQGSSLPQQLHLLFQKVLQAAKKIRSHFSSPKLADQLEEKVLDRLVRSIGPNGTVLLVGASLTNERIGLFLKEKSQFRLAVTNRSKERGEQLASKLACPLFGWEEKKEWFGREALILATRSRKPILSLKDLPETPPLLLDLGIPQNVSPDVKEHPLSTLFNIDQIQGVGEKREDELEKIVFEESIRIFSLLETKRILSESLDTSSFRKEHSLDSSGMGYSLGYFPSLLPNGLTAQSRVQNLHEGKIPTS